MSNRTLCSAPHLGQVASRSRSRTGPTSSMAVCMISEGLHWIAFHHAALEQCGRCLLSLKPYHAVLIISRRQSEPPAVGQCVDAFLIGPCGFCRATVLKARHQVAQGKTRLEWLVAIPTERGAFDSLPKVLQVDGCKQPVAIANRELLCLPWPHGGSRRFNQQSIEKRNRLDRARAINERFVMTA